MDGSYESYMHNRHERYSSNRKGEGRSVKESKSTSDGRQQKVDPAQP